MADYTITITDKLKIAALTAARDEFNNTLFNRPGGRPGAPSNAPIEEMPGFLATNQEYLQSIIDRAVKSYAVKFGLDDDIITTKEAELTTLKANLARAKE